MGGVGHQVLPRYGRRLVCSAQISLQRLSLGPKVRAPLGTPCKENRNNEAPVMSENAVLVHASRRPADVAQQFAQALAVHLLVDFVVAAAGRECRGNVRVVVGRRMEENASLQLSVTVAIEVRVHGALLPQYLLTASAEQIASQAHLRLGSCLPAHLLSSSKGLAQCHPLPCPPWQSAWPRVSQGA